MKNLEIQKLNSADQELAPIPQLTKREMSSVLGGLFNRRSSYEREERTKTIEDSLNDNVTISGNNQGNIFTDPDQINF